MTLLLVNQTLKQAIENISKLGEYDLCVLVDYDESTGVWAWASKEALSRKNLIISKIHKREKLIESIKFALNFTRPNDILNILDGDKLVPLNKYKKLIEKKLITNKSDKNENPLVSITVHNYNYGKYLKNCLESLINQTYKNIEILFSDNASSDDSWIVACELQKKHPKLISITRNEKNKGPEKNLQNCLIRVKGKYRIEMCSDDYLESTCIEKAVRAFKKFPDVGFVMFHRKIVNEDGSITQEKPFYDESYLINGIDQAEVYMMAAVNPSISQIIYDTEKASKIKSEDSIISRWWGARIKDFKMCLEYPIIYISEPLVGHRDHKTNDSKTTENNLLEIIGPIIMSHSFVEWSNSQPKIKAKLEKSIEKLASLSLRYSSRSIRSMNNELAKKYFYLSRALSEKVERDPLYKELDNYFKEHNSVKKKKIYDSIIGLKANLAREVSYPPPTGSKQIRI